MVKKKQITIGILIFVVILCICGIGALAEEDDTGKSKDINDERMRTEDPVDDVVNFEPGDLYSFKKLADDNGYTVTYFYEPSFADFTDMVSLYDEDELKKWAVIKIRDIDQDDKTIEAIINSYEDIAINEERKEKEQKLEETLSSSSALTAIKKYGENLYPYGFKLHSNLGLIELSVWDDDTWFIKCEATITNEFGTKSDTVCEGKVSGTSDNPKVKDFYVS